MKQKPTQQSKIIILRGNSASGKSTVARLLQDKMSPHPILIEQDYFRRQIVKEKDGGNVICTELMLEGVRFGMRHNRHIIIEGIFARKNYQSFFDQIIDIHPTDNYYFYFDISFKETLRRHESKSAYRDYGASEMRSWWNERDLLKIKGEKIIGETLSEDEIANEIMKGLKA